MPTTTVALCVPCYDGIGHRASERLLILMLAWKDLAPPGWVIKPIIAKNSPVDLNRNRIVRCAMEPLTKPPELAGCDMISGAPADYLLWNDTDCSLESIADYVRLVRDLEELPADVGILGVPLPVQQPTGDRAYNLCTMKGKPLRPGYGAQEVQAIGTGISVMRAEVFRRVEWPWFRFRYFEGEARAAYLAAPMTSGSKLPPEVNGEDYGLCDAAREKGLRTFAAMHLVGSHTIRRDCKLVPGDHMEGS